MPKYDMPPIYAAVYANICSKTSGIRHSQLFQQCTEVIGINDTLARIYTIYVCTYIASCF